MIMPDILVSNGETFSKSFKLNSSSDSLTKEMALKNVNFDFKTYKYMQNNQGWHQLSQAESTLKNWR
jgi:hypothetical protein